MKYFIGLDVSLKTTSICAMKEDGTILKEICVTTDPQEIFTFLNEMKIDIALIGIEAGGISHWLVKELKKFGLPVVCIDPRKMAAAIAIRANKTDKNDAREIANAIRTGYFGEIYQKEDIIVATGTLLTARELLVEQRTQTIDCIRGILRAQGNLNCGSSQYPRRFVENVKRAIKDLPQEVCQSINALLNTYEAGCREIDKIDQKMEEITKEDEEVQLLKTIPGVGAVTALAFKVVIGDPSRFKNSKQVGAYLGMTPKQYSSGETHHQGHISKMGSKGMRQLLTMAAMCMMYNTKSWSRLKLFGLKIKKKHGHKVAVVALGRKLAVVMHRMLVDHKAFEYGSIEQKEIDKLYKETKPKKSVASVTMVSSVV